MEYVLEMKDISKTFPGVKALDHVQLQVKPGEVHALMGENGAGKSTLMKILMGIYIKGQGGGEITSLTVNPIPCIQSERSHGSRCCDDSSGAQSDSGYVRV